MNKLLHTVSLLVICLLSLMPVCAQTPDATAIKKQMSDIRKSTNWDDPVAARKANERIKALSMQLMNAGNAPGSTDNNKVSSSQNNSAELGQDARNQKMEMLGQVMKSAAQGKGADILLAEPVREQIKDEYQKDDEPKVNCIPFLEEMTVLCIDMSSPTVQMIIDQMENFKSVKTLIITGGRTGSQVDLESLLAKASDYPLEQLYIINFRNFVNKVPRSVGNFPKLTFLALYNNRIAGLPAEIRSLVSLRKLYVDMNPLTFLTPAVNTLQNLDTLSLAKTQVTDDEIKRIRQQLPNCKLLLQ